MILTFIEFSNFLCRFFTKKRLNNKKNKIMATQEIVLRNYEFILFTDEGHKSFIEKGMDPMSIGKLFENNDLINRIKLVNFVKLNSNAFRENMLRVVKIPVDAIKANVVSIKENIANEYLESVEINKDRFTLWKLSNEQPKKFATLEEAIISDAPKAEVMRLLEEFKKTIPAPMPSKPVPDQLPCSDSEDDE